MTVDLLLLAIASNWCLAAALVSLYCIYDIRKTKKKGVNNDC